MVVQLELGLDIIRSYKRLSYTPWHALAEFVDNSTQAYFNNQSALLERYAADHDVLEVSIVYDRDGDYIRIADNSIGMSYPDLAYALRVGARPEFTGGRSQFGMGMKTAACWLGNVWSVRTKKLGETVEHRVEVDVERVAEGENVLPYYVVDVPDEQSHYTVVEITDLNRRFHGRTLGKIRDFLQSMYRQDLRQGILSLKWQGEPLSWEESDDQFLQARDGSRYKKDFAFVVDGKDVTGWIGVLNKGSRSKAGLSILHAGRVVRGWPESWRPESIFGQFQGSNDLVNQRITGELHLNDFEVTHTKDDILWLGTEEEDVERELRNVAAEYVAVAKARRRADDDERGPSDVEIQTAIEELNSELTSSEFLDLLTLTDVPPPEAVRRAVQPLLEAAAGREPVFGGTVGRLRISGYLSGELSSNDPYVLVESTTGDRILVVINLHHPFLEQISGSEGALNYFRQCTYDAVAEWQARHKAASLDPDTIKLLKDRLLRLPSEIEMHAAEAEAVSAVGPDGMVD